MKRKAILLSVAGAMVAARLAGGQAYVGSVLYPLNKPYSNTDLSPNGASAGQIVGSYNDLGLGFRNALLYAGTSNAVQLNPNWGGFVQSVATGTDGIQQVGMAAGQRTGNNWHAVLWSGSATSAVDLNPTNLSGITQSEAVAISGNQQVGNGYGTGTGNNYHAFMWDGSAGSSLDLSPTNLIGITTSYANGTDGVEQVGIGAGPGAGGNNHALLWYGSADSAVDLNPPNLAEITSSSANAVCGSQQVGWGSGGGTVMNGHALLWNGTAASAVDLNPTSLTEFTDSEADGTNGIDQVGRGWGSATNNNFCALLWHGTAASAVDLQTLLPSTGIPGDSWGESVATTIDPSGNTFGIAGGTFDGVTGDYAVEWSPVSPVPEPTAGSILALVGAAMLMLRRRNPSA